MLSSKFESVNGFVVVDFAGQPATGLLRAGPKILASSAKELARSVTYSFASFGIERSGASAGLNIQADLSLELEALSRELSESSADGSLHLLAGKGVPPDGLNGPHDRSDLTAGSNYDLVASALAAGRAVCGGSLEGLSFGIDNSTDPLRDDLAAAFSAAGAFEVEGFGSDDGWDVEVDLLIVGSRPGVLDHFRAESLRAKTVLAWGPVPVTARGLATLMKAGVCYVPDFLSACGSVIGSYIDGDVGAVVEELVLQLLADGSERSDLFVKACEAAERRLQQWPGEVPFGRPLVA